MHACICTHPASSCTHRWDTGGGGDSAQQIQFRPLLSLTRPNLRCHPHRRSRRHVSRLAHRTQSTTDRGCNAICSTTVEHRILKHAHTYTLARSHSPPDVCGVCLCLSVPCRQRRTDCTVEARARSALCVSLTRAVAARAAFVRYPVTRSAHTYYTERQRVGLTMSSGAHPTHRLPVRPSSMCHHSIYA